MLYVRCGACGEIVRVRADRRWDLVEEFDDPAVPFALHKDVLGARCPRLMSLHARFDRRYALQHHEVVGGALATADEYEAAQAGRPGR